ncbi:MAG: Sensor protein kinase WalK [Actinobacteria bacterium ADurb.Bin346]|nr:MAG: Sensor protein kinase WalK [Actinobacteria bacterium ADurb.Bin346]
MLELAQHILDIAENSTRAGAKLVTISVIEDQKDNRLTIEIGDDGCGMKEEELTKVLDPFYTTKKVRQVGLGLPLLKDAAQKAEGKFGLQSVPAKGTKVTATFQLDHIDRQPLGNITATLISLIAANLAVDFIYDHWHNGRRFVLDTRSIRAEIDDIPIYHPAIIKYIRGVGSGLPIVKEAIVFSGGSVDIADNIQKGTVVSLRIDNENVINTVLAQGDRGGLSFVRPGDILIKETKQDAEQKTNAHVPKKDKTVEKQAGEDFDNLKLSLRQIKILSLVLELDETGPSKIAKELGFSLSTSYRDLISLEEAGLLRMTGSGKRQLTDMGKKYLEYYLNNF